MGTFSSKFQTLFSANLNQQSMALGFTTVLITIIAVAITRFLYKWRNPNCHGVLPPGSMGFPFIGETLDLVLPSAFIDLPPFFQKRFKRYGPIFRTNVAGRPMIITSDPEFCKFLFRQDGKLVEAWSMDTYAQVFDQARQSSRKYIRNLVLHHFGIEPLKEKLFSLLEDLVNKTLLTWSNQESIEVKGSAIMMTIDFAKQQIFSGDLENAELGEMYNFLAGGLMSFPINCPGTKHHKCLQIQKKVKKLVKEVVQKRLADGRNMHGDLLDQIIQDMISIEPNMMITEEFIVQLMFGLLYITSASTSTTLALAFKLLADHPTVLEKLTVEHEEILNRRENKDAPLTWSEYKSMTFTMQVINEVLRLGNISPGLFRRALEDIHVNGYTIPKGWGIVIATAALHLNSNQFQDPLSFNPGRWKDIQPDVASKWFMPFGSGMKQCAGAEYSQAFMAIFLHVLVTKYRWRMVKGGKIVRSPIISFPDGVHFKISEKVNN